MLVSVINAPDSRINNFEFETIDDIGRLIGKSRSVYEYISTPLILNATATKNETEIEKPMKINVNLTLQKALNNG